MTRASWFKEHPHACTCVECSEKRTIARTHGKVGRNARCPCGSGKKFKRCHGT